MERRGFLALRPERQSLAWAVVASVVVHVVGVGLIERLQPTPEEMAWRVLFVTPTVGGSLGGLGSLWHSVLVGSDGLRQVQFTINMVVYALTQEGSITHQLMQTVK